MEHLYPAKRGVFTRALGITCMAVLFLVLPQAKGQKEVCQQRPMDIVFVIDGSRSVRPWNFKTVKDAVKDMVDSFENIGPHATQIGLIQYGSRVRQEFALNHFQTKEEVNEAIDSVEYKETGTMTGQALKYLVTRTFTAKRGARMDDLVQRVAVVITDGRAQDGSAARYWQKKVKDAGIEIFAIGVGRRANDSELRVLASEPKNDHTFHVKNFDAILNLPVMLTREICDIDECAANNHTCEHICKNTIGSYECECFADYELQEDGRSCRRKQPPIPANLTFTEITHTSMRVSWELDAPEREEIVEYYNVVYEKSDGSGVSNQLQVTERTAVLENLTPGTEYTVTVTAVAEEMESAPVRGRETTLRLGETEVVLSNSTLTTLTARWQPGGGDLLSGYRIHISKVTELDGGVAPDQEFTYDVGAEVESKVFHNLIPGQQYEVVVTPMHGELPGGKGSNTESTRMLSPPDVTIPKTTLSMVDVEWTGVGMEADRFKVTLSPSDGVNGELTAMEVGGDVRSTTFRFLYPDTWYTATVVGLVEEGGQVFTSSEGSTQGKTKNIQPPVVTITETGLSTADVMWTVQGKAPTAFTVTYYPTDDPEDKKSFDTEDISAELRDLKPGTEYEVEVVAVDYDDDIKFTSEPGADADTTKMLHAPKVTSTGQSYTSATVNWGDIGMVAQSWIIKYGAISSDEELLGKDSFVSQFVSGDLRSVVLNDLVPGVEYEVMVVGVVEEDGKTFESPVGKSGFTLGDLNPPVVEITSTTATTLDATWESDIVADHYVVKIKEVGGELEQTFTVPGDIKEKTFTSLKPGTEYKVTACVEMEEGDDRIRSGPGMAADFTKPAPPGNLRSVDSTPRTLTATFELPEGGSEYFEAYCKPDGVTPMFIWKYRIAKHNLTFTCNRLIPAIKYEILVWTRLRDMRSEQTIIKADTKLGPPQNFELSEPTSHSIVATWEAPERALDVTEYVLQYRSAKFGSVEEVRIPGSDTRYVLMKLHPQTEYEATIRAISGEIISPQVMDSETTLPDSINIQVTDVGFNSISVSWPRSSVPHVTSQQLSWIPQEIEGGSPPLTPGMTISLEPDQTSHVISDVTPATIYDVSIQYHYPLGKSEVATVNATTLAPPPGPLSFSNITDVAYFVHWGMPEHNAMPVGYTYSFIPSYGGSVIDIGIASGEVLDLNIENLLPGTKYNVTVVANYKYDIVSEPVIGEVRTLEQQEEPVCTCGLYLAKQNEMQKTINRLVTVIDKLAEKIDRMGGGSSESSSGLQSP